MIVTDNGSNMLKSVRVLREMNTEESSDSESDDESSDSTESDGDDIDPEPPKLEKELFHRLPCLAHTLQLVVHALNKVTGYSNILGKARCIVSSVRRSSVATQKLMEKAGKTVIPDCTTRWNSSFLMMQHLLDVKGHLSDVLESVGCDSLLGSEWQKLEQVCVLLQPFAQHTQIMQVDTVALSSIIPVILDLSCHLQASKDVQGMSEMANTLFNALNDRQQVYQLCIKRLRPLASSSMLSGSNRICHTIHT